ncbi:hypothetical protein D9M72_494600 [compost metagenome]
MAGLRGIDPHEVEPLQERAPLAGIEVAGIDEGLRALVGKAREGFGIPFMAAHADDARALGQVAIAMAHVQRGQQLAGRQVTAAAEDHKVHRPWIGRAEGRR